MASKSARFLSDEDRARLRREIGECDADTAAPANRKSQESDATNEQKRPVQHVGTEGTV